MTKAEILEKYSFENYKPRWNSIPVIYNGIEYKSKAQCCALNGISTYKLNKYLKEQHLV